MIKAEESSKKKYVYLAVLFATTTLFVGVYFGFRIADAEYKEYIYSFKSIRSQSHFTFTNPLLGTDAEEATKVGFYKEVKQDIQDTATLYQNKGLVQDYGVYMKSLAYPLWFGVNERKEFLPASLYKLPIAVAVYKEVEKGKISLSQKVMYTEKMRDQNKSDSFYSQTELIVGTKYSVEELVAILITKSDNGAKDALVSVVSEETLQETLRIVSVDGNLRLTQISPWMYSFYLRILYNATFLTEENSEKLLALLADSLYKDALVKGVPAETKVAHKYGLYNEEGGTFELHDCGIIYAQKDPYILCIMTKGTNVEALQNFIAEVSSTVYNYQNVEH